MGAPQASGGVHQLRSLTAILTCFCWLASHGQTTGAVFERSSDAASRLRALSDIRLWRYQMLEDSLVHQKFEPRTRIWDRSILRHANAVVNYEQMRPLLKKLDRGERIIVTAIGSSVVATYGGCWGNHTRVQEVVQTLHHTYSPEHGQCSGQDVPGWLHGLLVMINQTWPHPDHLLVNLGSGGHFFTSYADQGCIDSHIPLATDLVILEQNERGLFPVEAVSSAERLLRRLAHHFYKGQQQATTGSSGSSTSSSTSSNVPAWQAPPTIMVNVVSVTEHGTVNMNPCMVDGNACDTTCKVWNHTLLGASARVYNEDVYTPLLQYFGYTSLSLRNLYNTLLRDGVLLRLGVPPCKFFAAMVEDSMHPDLLGKVLMADLLVNHLADAVEHFEREAAEGGHIAATQGRLLPHEAYTPGGNEVLVSRCYGAMEASRQDEFVPDEHSAFVSLAGSNSLGQLQVISKEGWEFVEYQVHGTNRKYKPGWVSLTPGSIMQIQVDTQFEPRPGMGAVAAGGMTAATAQRAQLVLAHLRSYEHMGRAELSCVQNCACEGGVIDAHVPGEHISVLHLARFEVTQHPACVVQLKVLPETSSGQHKFKVVQVAITMKVQPEGMGVPS